MSDENEKTSPKSDRPIKSRKRPPIEINHAGVVWVDLQTAGARLNRRPEAVVQMARKIGAIRKCGLGNIVDLNRLREVYESKGKKACDRPDPPGYVSLRTLATRGFSRASLLIMGIMELGAFEVVNGIECLKADFNIDEFVLSEHARSRSEAYANSRDRKSQKEVKGK